MGYTYNQKAQNIIKRCDAWYSSEETDFHTRCNVNGVSKEIETINFAKRGCADDANLCEVIEINTGESSFEDVNKILNANRFDVMYRKQLEQMSATGTVGGYVRLDNADILADGSLKGGDIRINYCYGENIVPRTIENDEVIECAFVGENLIGGKKITVLVSFTLDESKKYVADTYYFDDEGEKIDLATSLQLGEVKPFFIMRTAEVNNIKGMDGYGLPKIYSVIPVLKALDLAYAVLFGDLDKGEKMVFINELLSCVATDITTGQKYLTKKQQELFVLLGERLPEQNVLVEEYNPQIRIDEVTKIFETLLSLFSLMFGYGTKKYTFENGQIKTATEYIGSRQDALQELNKQRNEAIAYIEGICKAVMWFSNTFEGTSFNLDNMEINVEFDDSYVTDREAELERIRNDALTFDIPTLTIWYMMKAYNLDEAEATKLVLGSKEEKDEEDLEDANNGEDE